MPHDNALERNAPVCVIDTGSAHDRPRAPQGEIALCPSGGGYRAMLFHVGALFVDAIVGPLRAFAGTRIEGRAIAGGADRSRTRTTGLRDMRRGDAEVGGSVVGRARGIPVSRSAIG